MLAYLHPLDMWILERAFQPLVIWIHKHLGINNYTIAKYLSFGAQVSALATLGMIALTFASGNARSLPILTIVIVLFHLSKGVSVQKQAANLERNYVRLWANSQLPNFRAMSSSEATWRRTELWILIATVPFLVITVFLKFPGMAILSFSLLTVTISMLAAACYFKACTPPPPGSSRRTAQVTGPAQFAW